MYSLFFFVLGLVSAALAFFFAYLTQLAMYNQDLQAPLFWGVAHWVWLTLALEAAAGSLGFFAVGAYSGIGVLGSAQ
jgi:hypothetical protein